MINPSWLAICHHHGFKQAGTRLNASPKVGRAWLVFQQPHPKKNTRLWSPGFSEKRDRAFKIIKNSSWNEGYIQLHNVIEIDLKFHPQIDTKLTREKCMLIFPQLVNPRNKKQGAHQIHVVGQSFPWTVHQKNMLFARHLSSNRDVSEINQFC